MKAKALLLTTFFITILVFFIYQFKTTAIIGADGYLHIQMANLIKQKGWFLSNLPQASQSWFASEHFDDKDWLYHLYLVPFTTFGLLNGAKIGAFLITIAFIAIFTYLAYKNSKKTAPLAIIGLILSSQFIRDFSEVRPIVLAVGCLLLFSHFLIKGNLKLTFLFAFITSALHLSGITTLVLAAIYVFFQSLTTKKIDPKPVLVTMAAFVLSFLIHPNFPQNIFLYYYHGILIPIYAAKKNVLEFGAEFFPFYTHEYYAAFPIVFVGLFLTIFLGHFLNVKSTPKSRTVSYWLLFFAFYFLLSLTGKKYATMAYPFFLLWFSQYLQSLLTKLKLSKNQDLSVIIILIMIVSTLQSLPKTISNLFQSSQTESIIYNHYSNVATTLNQLEKQPYSLQSALVFHTNWSDSQFLIGLSPQLNYLVTLDPIYMYSYNKPLYQLYRSIAFAQVEKPVDVIKNTFHAKYIYVSPIFFASFAEQLKNDPNLKNLYQDQIGSLYQIL